MKFFVDIKSRFLSTVISLVLITGLIFYSQSFAGQIILGCVAAILSVLGIREYAFLLKQKNIHLPWLIMAVGAVIWIISLYVSLFDRELYFAAGVIFIIFAFVIFMYYFNKIENAIVHISTCFFGFIYVVIPIGLMLKILYPYSTQDGRLWLAYLIVVTKITDIGAYLIGRSLGSHKLAPDLSPGKTIAGALGGFICAILASLLFYWFATTVPDAYFNLDWVEALVFGSVLGVLGQVGDLAESLMKRDAHVKDSNDIPGIGGVLDLLDSLLFTAPILYLFMKVL
ncbi:MAG: phosphatidate cytidylyltransferase [Simkaniaceae bacterium]|nr:phosphatidate cytidylyltransferase [Simkaniaceae bacterium]